MLSLRHGIALAIGSIAGAGLLFLPSLTLASGGSDVLLVWAGALAIALPVLLLFADSARDFEDGGGIETLVARGLGPHAAAAIPPVFLGIVVLGLPAGALVGGGYLEAAVGGGAAVSSSAAALVACVAAATVLAGVRTGARLQGAATLALIVVAVALVALTVPEAAGSYDAARPQLHSLEPLFTGLLIAFFAFAGFENLTFIAAEFRRPRRDFPIAMAVAFGLYGLLAVALTVNLAGALDGARVDELAGLAQLAGFVEPRWLSTLVVTTLALVLVEVNTTSWIWGMSRMIGASAEVGRLPGVLAKRDARGVPRRGVILLAAAIVAVTGAAARWPGLVDDLVTLASAGFVAVYLLAVGAYARVAEGRPRRVAAGALLVLLAVLLASGGVHSLYALALVAAGSGASALRSGRTRRAAAACS